MSVEQSTEQDNATPENVTAESEFADLNPPPAEPKVPVKLEAAAKPVEAPAATAHPQALIDAAVEAGFSERFISKLDTDALYEALVNQHRKLSEAVVAAQPRRQRERDDDDERPRRETKPEPGGIEDELAYLESEEGGIAPRLVNVQRTLAKELRELKAREAERIKFETERRSADIFDAAEEAIDSLGKSTEQKFSKEQKQTLFRAAGITEADSARTVKRKITEAGLTLFQGLTKKKASPPLPPNGAKKPAAEEFGNGMNPPSSSRPSRLKGDRAAQAAVHDYLVENNIRPNNSHIELEGVPE